MKVGELYKIAIKGWIFHNSSYFMVISANYNEYMLTTPDGEKFMYDSPFFSIMTRVDEDDEEYDLAKALFVQSKLEGYNE